MFLRRMTITSKKDKMIGLYELVENITKIHSYLNRREKICNYIVCIPQKAFK